MESIIFFVVAMAINLVFKSAKDKEKIEKARAKRAEQLKNNPMDTRRNQPQSKSMAGRTNRDKSVREILIARDRDEERANTNKEREGYASRKHNDTIQEYKDKKSSSREYYEEKESLARLEKEKQEIRVKQLEAQKEIKKGFEKKRLVNAIIWSEILGEPKSIQNLKKGM